MFRFQEACNLVRSLFGEDFSYEGNTLGKNRYKKVCRNEHYIFNIKSNRIILKAYKNPNSAIREKRFYEFFTQTPLVQVPRLYFANQEFLIADFVFSEKYNLKQTIIDWARVHSATINMVGENLQFHDFLIDIASVQKDRKILPSFAQSALNTLVTGLSSSLSAITHGDLYENNILTNSERNYYIDFEKGGISHPARDLGLLLFNSPELKEEIIKLYRNTINFDYPEIERDIERYLVLRLMQVIIGLNKDTHLPEDFRQRFSNKAENMLEEIVLSNRGLGV